MLCFTTNNDIIEKYCFRPELTLGYNILVYFSNLGIGVKIRKVSINEIIFSSFRFNGIFYKVKDIVETNENQKQEIMSHIKSKFKYRRI